MHYASVQIHTQTQTQAHTVSQPLLTLHTSHSRHVRSLRNKLICGCFTWAVLCRSRRKCLEVSFLFHLTKKGIKMWHFSSLVTGKSAAALLLLWKWWALALFKCKSRFERCFIAVPSGAFDVYCLFLSEYITNIALAHCTGQRQNEFHFKAIHIHFLQMTTTGAVI